MRSMRLSPIYFHRRFKYCVVSGYSTILYDCVMMPIQYLIVIDGESLNRRVPGGEAPMCEIILISYNNIPRFLGIIYNNYYLQNGRYTHATAGCRIVDIRE